LRNCVQHFAAPHNVDFGTAAQEFIYEVIDPFIFQCWGLYAVNYCEDSAGNEYLLPTLAEREILFLVPPGTKAELIKEWPDNAEYCAEMKRRFAAAN
jgi:hypothetical protein